MLCRIGLFASLLFFGGSLSTTDLIKRRVLILDFVNQKNDASSAFLTQTIPDSFVKPLEETNAFDILDPQKGRNLALAMKIPPEKLYEVDTAAALGKKAEADIVLIGNFITIQGTVQVQAQAVDVSSQRVKVTDNIVTSVSGKLFDGINTLSNRLSTKMKAVLPPLPEREIVRYQKTNELHVAAYGIYAQPLGTTFIDIYAGSLGAYLQVDYSVFQFGKFFLAPAIGGSYLKYGSKSGIFPALRLQTFSFLGGLDLGYSLFSSFTIHISGLVGAAISELQRDFDNAKIQSRDMELRGNIELRYSVWRNMTISLAGSYSQILFIGNDLNGFQGMVGLGYGF